MKIILADDNKVFREALVMFLESELNYDVISEHENGLDLINDDKICEADILLLDIEMPKLNGIKAMDVLDQKYNCLKVIAITDYYEMVYLKDLITHGFKGCVFKNAIFEKLKEATLAVNEGQLYFPKGITID